MYHRLFIILSVIICANWATSPIYAGPKEHMVFAATAPGAATQISQKATQANSDQVENWPRTLETAVSAILAGMKAKDKRILKSFQKEDLIRYHFGWGTGIRNSMGLWRGNEALMRSCAKKIVKIAFTRTRPPW